MPLSFSKKTQFLQTNQDRKVNATKAAKKGLLIIMLILAWVTLSWPYLFRIIPTSNNQHYTPFSRTAGMIVSDETSVYAPLVNEFMQGRWFSSNAFFAEGKDRPMLPATWVPTLMVSVFSIFGLNIHWVWILSHLVWPFVALLFFGLWLRELVNNGEIAFLLSIIFFLGNDFFTAKTAGYLLGTSHTHYLNGPLFFTRHFSPGIVIAIFALTLLFCSKMFQAPKYRYYVLLTGLFSGLLFYTYFFYWTIWIPALGFLAVFFLVQKKWDFFYRICSVLALAGIISLPWFVCYYVFHTHPSFSDYQIRLGIGHAQPSSLGHTLLLVICVCFCIKGNFPNRFVLAAIGLAGIVVLNFDYVLPILTLQKEHWHANFLKTFECAVLSVGFFEIFRKRGLTQWFSRILMLLAGVFTVAAFCMQHNFATRYYKTLTLDKFTIEVIEFVQTFTEKNEVVFVENPELCDRILLYTSRPTFLHKTDYQPVTTMELVERAAYLAQLVGLTYEHVNSYIDYIMANSKHRMQHNQALKQLVLDSVSFDMLKKKYRLDYMIFNKDQKLTVSSVLKVVFSNDRFVVYQIVS